MANGEDQIISGHIIDLKLKLKQWNCPHIDGFYSHETKSNGITFVMDKLLKTPFTARLHYFIYNYFS